MRKNIIFAMRGPHRNHQQHSIGTGRGRQRSNQNMAPSYKDHLNQFKQQYHKGELQLTAQYKYSIESSGW